MTLLIPLSSWTTISHCRFHVVTHNPPRYWHDTTSHHNLCRCHRTKLVFDSVSHSDFLVSWCTLVDVLLHSITRITTTIPSPREQPTPDPPSSSLEERLQHLLDWQRPLLCNVEHPFPMVSILHHLRCPFSTTSEIICATDGGATLHKGSFGWTLRQDDIDIVTCSGPVTGPSPGSFWSECYATLLILLYLYLVMADYPAPVPHCQLTVHLDCQSLISKLRLHQSRHYFTPK